MIDWLADVHAYRDFIDRKSVNAEFNIVEGVSEFNRKLVDHASQFYQGVPVFEVLEICDGQFENAQPIFFNEYWLLPQHDILDYIEIGDEFHGIILTEEISSEVKSRIWHHSWFPLCIDGFGDKICIDFDPTEKGTMGQIIKVLHDSSGHKKLASSLREFLVLAESS